MILLIISIIICAIVGFSLDYDGWNLAGGIGNAFIGAIVGFWLGVLISGIVGSVGYNEQAQTIVSQERYTMAANGYYTLDDGELNFGYIDDNGNFQAVDVDDNFNIAAAPAGETSYVEIVKYKASDKVLAACSLGLADKGTVFNIYIADTSASTIE